MFLCCFSVLPTLPCIAWYIDLSCIILAWAYCHVLVLFSVLPTLPCIASYIYLSCIILAWAHCLVLVLFVCASYLAMYCIIYRLVMHHKCIILASCWLCITPCLTSCLVVFLCWVELEAETEYKNEVTTEVEYEEPSYDPIDDSTGKMTWPRYHYYLCLLLEVSLFSLLPRCPCLFVSLLL